MSVLVAPFLIPGSLHLGFGVMSHQLFEFSQGRSAILAGIKGKTADVRLNVPLNYPFVHFLGK